MLRIIDNKRVELTDSEFKLYQEICKSYDRQNFQGADLFRNLFETNEKGIIIFMKPPQDKVPFSMEVYMFLISIMVHQHLGVACNEVHSLIGEAKQIISEGKALIQELKTSRVEASK